MKPKRLYLSEPGMVNALGDSPKSIWKNLLAGNQQGIVQKQDLLIDGNNTYVGAVAKTLPDIGSTHIKLNSRNNRLLLAAYRQIDGPVKDLITKYGKDRVAVVLGSSTSGISETEAALKHKAQYGSLPACYHYQQHEMGSPAMFLASLLQLENVAITVSTACSSSGKAFLTARNLIHSGICDAALVGGVDTLCRLTLNGFHALESVSPGICNPFSRNRNGITIGEGSALFILSAEPSSVELAGCGESSDAYHMSAPDPSGAGAMAAMKQALDAANIEPADIGYINLHGTATLKNDEMEATAIDTLFGPNVLCSSTKALTGHTLGAAGATELGICWLAMSEINPTRALPVHVWDGIRDEQLPEIRLVTNECYESRHSCYMMSNSFAFGGNNVSLIIKKTAGIGLEEAR